MTILAAVAEYEVGLKHERAEAKRWLSQRGGFLGGAKPKLDAEQVAAVRRADASDDTVASLARVHKASRMTGYRMLKSQRLFSRARNWPGCASGSLSGMVLLKVGDRVENRSGCLGTVVQVNDDNALVEFDNGQPSGWFGRDEHHYDGGVLRLI